MTDPREKKLPVRIELRSHQVDAEGDERHAVQHHDGLWYDQGGHQYLVYQTDGVSTTLRLDAGEWRLFRRGNGIESWQLFREGEDLESQLDCAGSSLPLCTRTHHLSARMGTEGGELRMSYSLFSQDAHMGDFELSLHLTPASSQDPRRGELPDADRPDS